jgi:hypothetical protein
MKVNVEIQFTSGRFQSGEIEVWNTHDFDEAIKHVPTVLGAAKEGWIRLENVLVNKDLVETIRVSRL